MIRASVGNIVNSDEMYEYIDEGSVQSIDELDEMQKDSREVLAHNCTER